MRLVLICCLIFPVVSCNIVIWDEFCIDFTVSDLPSGSSGSFYPSSLSDEGTTVLTLGGLGSLSTGDYPFLVTGSGSAETVNLYLILRILSDQVSNIELIFPPDGAVDQPVVIEFTWELGDESVVAVSENENPLVGQDIHVDPGTGRRYSLDENTGESEWVVE